MIPALALMLSLQAAPTARQLREADDAFRAGSAAAEQHDLARARAAFEKVVSLLPRVGAGHSALGTVLLELNEVSGAVAELRIAHDIDPNDQLAAANLATALSHEQQYPEALKLFADVAGGPAATEPARPFSPGLLSPEGVLAYAAALAGSGRGADANAVLSEAAAADPSAWQYEDGLGSLLAREQKYAEAKEHLSKAIAADPGQPLPHQHLGSVEMLDGQLSEAVAELTTAARLAPGDAETALQLGRAQFAMGDIDGALKTLTRARDLAPDAPDVRYQLGLTLTQAGRPREALPLLAEVVANQPRGREDPGVLTNYALALVQSGNAKDAIAVYARALALEPGNALVHEDLGVAYLQQNDLDRAIAEFQAGIAADPSGPQNAVLHYDLGLAFKLKDRLPEAVTELTVAEKLDPSLPDPPYTLGVLHMQGGQFAEAARDFETATSLRPDNGQAWASLGSVYKQMDQPEKAIAALREAARLLPAQPGPHVLLGSILAQKGDKDEAAAERKKAAELTRVAVSRQKANFAMQTGEALLKQGDAAKAAEQLQTAVDADPGYAEAHRALADALERLHRGAEAAVERQKATALDH